MKVRRTEVYTKRIYPMRHRIIVCSIENQKVGECKMPDGIMDAVDRIYENFLIRDLTYFFGGCLLSASIYYAYSGNLINAIDYISQNFFKFTIFVAVSYFIGLMVYSGVMKIQFRSDKKYLFCWDDIRENDKVRLIEFLKQNFNIDWVKTAIIKKIDNGKTIIVSTEKNHLSLKLNDEKTEVNIEIDDGRTDKFVVKMKNSKINIYKIFKNPVFFRTSPSLPEPYKDLELLMWHIQKKYGLGMIRKIERINYLKRLGAAVGSSSIISCVILFVALIKYQRFNDIIILLFLIFITISCIKQNRYWYERNNEILKNFVEDMNNTITQK